MVVVLGWQEWSQLYALCILDILQDNGIIGVEVRICCYGCGRWSTDNRMLAVLAMGGEVLGDLRIWRFSSFCESYCVCLGFEGIIIAS